MRLPQRLSGTQWLVCGIAALGFAFDIYELLMLPLIVRPALLELINAAPGSPDFNHWVGLLFYVPAVCGGVFGLLGGYLTDLLGRRRVLVWSILIYAFSALAAGYSTSVEMLLFFRCTTFIGVCVEFVAAVAWLAELFDQPKTRESVLGYTQAFSSVGGLLVTAAYYLAVTYGDSLPAIYGAHSAWRYTLISGVIPALPLIIIRPFLPESPAWRLKKEAGTLKRPSFKELFQPQFRQTTLVTALLVACAYGAAFGAIQHTPRIVPGLEEVRDLPRAQQEQTVSNVQAFQEAGGLAGRFLFAFLAIRILSRRKLLRIFQIPGLVLIPVVFLYAGTNSLVMLKWGILLVGLLTVAQFSFWGNYLPRVYPTHLRGTGESFAANVGGRMFGTSAAYLTTSLVNFMPGSTAPERLAYAAAIVGFTVYAIGVTASFWLRNRSKRNFRTKVIDLLDRQNLSRRKLEMSVMNADQTGLTWLMFALLTVSMWGLYGVFLHNGQVHMADPVNGRYKAFLFVGLAYFLTAVLAPLVVLKLSGATWSFPATGMFWSLVAGIVGAVGAFGVLLAFGARGTPSVVMSIIFAGAPIVNAVVAMAQHPPAGGLSSIRWPFVLGILMAALGGCLVTLYRPQS